MSGQRIRHIEVALWGVSLMCIVAVSAAVVQAHPKRSHVVAGAPANVDDVSMYDRETLTQMADSVVTNDPFRAERRPSRVAFGTAPIAAAVPTPASRPALTLGGIVGGPPWRAILNGVPNHDGGTVVAPGDTVGGLRIRSIQRHAVVIQGQDTIWTLLEKH